MHVQPCAFSAFKQAASKPGMTVQMLCTRPREEWRADVGSRHKALEQFTKEDARVQFLRILRTLPYGTPSWHLTHLLSLKGGSILCMQMRPPACNYKCSALRRTFPVGQQ